MRYLIPSLFLILLATSCKEPRVPLQSARSTTQAIRFAVDESPSTLDPRRARNLYDITPVQSLFEGLCRLSHNNTVELALAEKIELSDDKKVYTFTLRPAQWSNKSEITAYDFEYSWKKSLDPTFNAPNAYMFFIIKGAQAAYEGKTTPESIGIKALDSKTLQITLEMPCVYFPELITTHSFYPVCKALCEQQDKINSQQVFTVCNGPFKVENWQQGVEINLIKNPEYYRANEVKLQKISFVTITPLTSLHLFERDEIEWTGSPLATIPYDAFHVLREAKKLSTVPAAATSMLRVNTAATLVSNQKIRQALAIVIDRQAIAEHVMHNDCKPTLHFVPSCFPLATKATTLHHDIEYAKKLFQNGLQELQVSSTSLKLSYVATERNNKIAAALQHDWQKSLGITIELIPQEWKTFCENLSKGNFQLALASWFADYPDPMTFLGPFQFTNNTRWQNTQFEKLLVASSQCTDLEKRKELLSLAEDILLTELPIIPLFHFNYSFLKIDALQKAFISPLGIIDLKEAYIARETTAP